jgi:hypothetical protein
VDTDNYRHLRILGELLHKDAHHQAGIAALITYRAYYGDDPADRMTFAMLILNTAEAYVRMVEQRERAYLT